MSDLWVWLFQSLYEDETRHEYYTAWRQAMNLDDSDPQAAIALLETTISRAKNSGDDWWELFLQHWKLQVLLHKARDFSAALDCAARATMEVRKGQFADFPQRVCLHEDLISAYEGIDPVGYATLIQNALDYMEREITPGVECEACHRGLRSSFYSSISHPEAVEAAWKYLEIAERKNSDFYRAYAYVRLCDSLTFHAREQARTQVKELSDLAWDYAHKGNCSAIFHEILMWQALAARWDKAPDANRAMRRALEARQQHGAAARPSYYVAGVLFYEEAGDLEAALQLINDELKEIEGSGELWREATRRVKKCELLAEIGLDWSEDANKARSVAAKLKNPEQIEEMLRRILK